MDDHPGEVLLGEVACSSMPSHEWRRRVAFLPAESQWWCDTVAEHFADGVDLSALGFDDATLGWEMSRCSSGERQRLGILRMLCNEPEVLLLDEPTANLDPDNAARVERLIRDYLESHEACCIWVSHDADQLQRIADRCMSFVGGALLEQEACG